LPALKTTATDKQIGAYIKHIKEQIGEQTKLASLLSVAFERRVRDLLYE